MIEGVIPISIVYASTFLASKTPLAEQKKNRGELTNRATGYARDSMCLFRMQCRLKPRTRRACLNVASLLAVTVSL